MNRRGFLGAMAALVALPVGAFAARSVPHFVPDVWYRPRLWFTPFGELDWIDMPSPITRLEELDDRNLYITCEGGRYILTHAGEPSQWWVRAVYEYRNGKRVL